MHDNINYLTNGYETLNDIAFNTKKWKLATEK